MQNAQDKKRREKALAKRISDALVKVPWLLRHKDSTSVGLYAKELAEVMIAQEE